MAISALVVSSVLLTAAPTTAPAVSKAKIWELGVTLSGALVYRMDSAPARQHANGQEFLVEARRMATELKLPLGDAPVVKAPQSDTVEVMGYLVGAKDNPITKELEKRGGRPAAALFELGLLSHFAMTSIAPGSENAKGIADMVEAAGRESGVARENWAGFADALRNGKTNVAAMQAMSKMITAVGAACGDN